jgi:hypothetical protein
MKFLIIVKATEESEAGAKADPGMWDAMGKFNEELIQAGIMKEAAGLKPSSQGKRVTFSGRNRAVVDGPFAETKELIAGFWIWECRSMDEAVEWVKKCPNPMQGESDIEIRPFHEMEDLAEILTPEQYAKLEERKAALAAKN